VNVATLLGFAEFLQFETLTRGISEAPIFHVRMRLAGHGTPLDSIGSRRRNHRPRVCQAGRYSNASRGHCPGSGNDCWNPTADRFVDPHLRIIGRGLRDLERCLTGWRSLGGHLVGRNRRSFGPPRTRGVVDRCPPVWVEAYRSSQSGRLGASLGSFERRSVSNEPSRDSI